MAKRAWYPTSGPGQLAMYTNIKGKITDIAPILGLTPAQKDRILLICNIFIAAYEYVEAIKATTSALVEWRDGIFTGQPTGTAAPGPPTFADLIMPVGAFIGIVTEFKDLRELMVALPGYTPSIGEDLMIVGAEQPSAPESSVTPELKVSTEPGFTVKVTGSLQGYDAVRLEYQKNGTVTWVFIGFGTKMPIVIGVTPTTPGQPESGRIRGIFIQDNVPYGNWSPDYPVTIS